MSGQWGKESWRRRWSAACRVEHRERILALDRVVREPAGDPQRRSRLRPARASAPSRNRSPDARRACSSSAGCACDDLLEREPLGARAAGRSARARPETITIASCSESRLGAPGRPPLPVSARSRSSAPRSASASRFGPSATVPCTALLRVARASARPPSPGSWRASASTAPTSPQASSTAAGACTCPRASAPPTSSLERLRRSAGETARPGSGRGRRARRGGTGAAPARRRAPVAPADDRGAPAPRARRARGSRSGGRPRRSRRRSRS